MHKRREIPVPGQMAAGSDDHEADRSLPHANSTYLPLMIAGMESLSDMPQALLKAPGATLVLQQSSVTTVSIIHRGIVRLTHKDEAGITKVLGLRGSGWCAGAVPMLLEQESTYSATAVSSCEVSVLSENDLRRRIATSADWAQHVFRLLCAEALLLTGETVRLLSQGTSALSESREAAFNEASTSVVSDFLATLKSKELAQVLGGNPQHLSELLRRRH